MIAQLAVLPLSLDGILACHLDYMINIFLLLEYPAVPRIEYDNVPAPQSTSLQSDSLSSCAANRST